MSTDNPNSITHLPREQNSGLTRFCAPSTESRVALADLSLYGSLLIVLFLFLILLAGCFWLAIGGKIGAIHAIIAGVASLATPLILFKYRKITCTKAFVLYALLLLAGFTSFFLAGSFYDISWDGQAYHQEAIIELANGWNPFHEDLPAAVQHRMVIAHYAKGAWIVAAAIFKLTGYIEYSKAVNWLLIFASLLVSLTVLLRITALNVCLALPIALVAAFNPVSIYQSLTFYVDGQVSSLLVCLIAGSTLLMQRRSRIDLVFLFMAVAIGLNLKFTCIAYIAVLSVPTVVMAWYFFGGRHGFKVAVTYALASIIGLGFIGFNPYVTNTMSNGHPVYPIMGPAKIDVIKGQRPTNFVESNRFKRLLISTLGKPEIVVGKMAELQIPFVFGKRELQVFAFGVDPRVAGWGPLFGGAWVLAASGILLVAAFFAKQPRLVYVSIGAALVILISVLVNPEAWWARFAPQYFLIPLLVALALLLCTQKPLKSLGACMLLVLAVNSGLIANAYFTRNHLMTEQLSRQLALLVEVGLPIEVYFSGFDSNRLRFGRANIEYTRVGKAALLSCQRQMTLAGSIIRFCFSE